MAQKVFREYKEFRLISDERDIMVPCEHRRAVIAWCDANGIEATVTAPSMSFWCERTFGVNLWRVQDEQQRVAFALRWA